jgi:hypothetical protein
MLVFVEFCADYARRAKLNFEATRSHLHDINLSQTSLEI